MDWDRDRMRLYVDDELLNEIDVEAAVNAGGDKRIRSENRNTCC